MIVLINDGAMAGRDVIFHEKHGLNQERLIQSRLLAADDRFDKERIIQFIENASKPKTAKSIREKSEELSGWLHSSKVALRKPDKDSVNSNSKGKDGTREFLSWRDSRLKLIPNPRENYVFKHYQDIRYYIKQYREENSTLDSSVPQPPKRVSAFYNPGFYNAPPQPAAREYTSAQLWSRINQNSNQNGTFQYTRRESQKNDIPRTAHVHKYKLAPNTARADSESSSESENKSGSTNSRKKSANGSKSSSTPVKSLTKVCVPNTNNLIPGVTSKASNNGSAGSPNGVAVKSDVSPNGSRTLDTLACVAAQEGQPDVEEMEAATAASETSEAISISQISTTCLGATAAVKQSPKLEASCTYHIFPSDSVLSTSPTFVSSSSTMMWNPQKSAFERKPTNTSKGREKDAGMNSPFKKSRSPNIKLSVVRGDRCQSKQETRKDGFPPLPGNKKTKGSMLRERTLTQTEIQKEELSVNENEPVLKVQSLKSSERSHSTVSFEELKRHKKSKRIRTPTKKYCMSAPDVRLGPEGQVTEQDLPHSGFGYRPIAADCMAEELVTDDGLVPYFRFWNNGHNRRPPAFSSKGRKWCVDGDLDLKNLAEMVLLDQDVRTNSLDPASRKKVHAPSIASGVHLSPRTLDGLTWREKLEVLRQINKPPEKIRRRPLRLTFYKADAECEMIGCRDPLSHDQVSHQRRIRHLIEQTKLKFTARPPADYVTSKSKYWATDPETGLDVHLNISQPKFAFSKRESDSNTPRGGNLMAGNLSEDMDGENIQYRLANLDTLNKPPGPHVPTLNWRAGSHRCSAPEITPRSYTCIYPGEST